MAIINSETASRIVSLRRRKEGRGRKEGASAVANEAAAAVS